MKCSPRLLIGLFALALAAAGTAYGDDDRPEHFEGKPARTLEEAVDNFSEYNDRLAAILNKDELGLMEVHEVHQLTYTLENALEKIRDELDDLADTLESVHVASEKADVDTVKSQGRAYLEQARKVVK